MSKTYTCLGCFTEFEESPTCPTCGTVGPFWIILKGQIQFSKKPFLTNYGEYEELTKQLLDAEDEARNRD